MGIEEALSNIGREAEVVRGELLGGQLRRGRREGPPTYIVSSAVTKRQIIAVETSSIGRGP